MDSCFRSNLQYFIFLKMNLSINITLQVIMKNFMFKERTWLWSSILVKKTKITRVALTRNLRNGDCLKIFLLAFCLFRNFFFFLVFWGGGGGYGVVESLFIVNLTTYEFLGNYEISGKSQNFIELVPSAYYYS